VRFQKPEHDASFDLNASCVDAEQRREPGINTNYQRLAPQAPLLAAWWLGFRRRSARRSSVREITTMSFSSSSQATFDQSYGAGADTLAANVFRLLQVATHEVERDKATAKAIIAKASSLLRVEIDRDVADPVQDVVSGGLAGWQVKRIRTYIDEHLAEPIKIADLSRLIKLSTAHFSRAFRRSFGEAPHAYLVRQRLDHAYHLILTSDAALSCVALDCGFADQAHFNKWFRKSTGTSPGAWRREHREAAKKGAVAAVSADTYSHRRFPIPPTMPAAAAIYALSGERLS
jgi:AraC family transcriptional regulator